MEFRKMVTITLYARQQKRHRCIEQSFGLCGRGWRWDDLGEWHWNVRYHMWNESPVQVRCMIQGAQDWCTGMAQRDGMGREVGGRFRMGNTCTPMADSCQCMAKPIQYCKVKKKKKKNRKWGPSGLRASALSAGSICVTSPPKNPVLRNRARHLSQLSSPWACLLFLLYLGSAEYFLTRAVKLLLTRSSLVFAVKLLSLGTQKAEAATNSWL